MAEGTKIVSVSSKTSTKVGLLINETEKTLFLIDGGQENGEDLNPENIFGSLMELRHRLIGGGRKKGALAWDAEVESYTLKKLPEYIFRRTDIEVAWCTSARRINAKTPMTAETGKGDRTQESDAKRQKAGREKEEVLIVRTEQGGTYADLLRKVRAAVDPENIGAEISNIRKTRAGDLLIAVKKGQTGGVAAKLKRELEHKMGQTKVVVLNKKRTLQVNGLDGVATAAEVKEAIKKILKIRQKGWGEVKVNALWPAYGEKQNASITMGQRDAEIILKEKNIKVGWVTARVRERIEVEKCFRCWENGHRSDECKGIDRRELCHKCGGKGHKAKDCTKERFCSLCSENGHTANSTGCPIFRKQLAMGRRQGFRGGDGGRGGRDHPSNA